MERRWNINAFVDITVPADGSAPLDTGTFQSTLVVKFGFPDTLRRLLNIKLFVYGYN